jgi:hypothetical protein
MEFISPFFMWDETCCHMLATGANDEDDDDEDDGRDDVEIKDDLALAHDLVDAQIDADAESQATPLTQATYGAATQLTGGVQLPTGLGSQQMDSADVRRGGILVTDGGNEEDSVEYVLHEAENVSFASGSLRMYLLSRLKEWIHRTLRSAVDGGPEFQEVDQAQNDIGWEAFLNGKVSLNWKEMQSSILYILG